MGLREPILELLCGTTQLAAGMTAGTHLGAHVQHLGLHLGVCAHAGLPQGGHDGQALPEQPMRGGCCGQLLVQLRLRSLQCSQLQHRGMLRPVQDTGLHGCASCWYYKQTEQLVCGGCCGQLLLVQLRSGCLQLRQLQITVVLRPVQDTFLHGCASCWCGG